MSRSPSTPPLRIVTNALWAVAIISMHFLFVGGALFCVIASLVGKMPWSQQTPPYLWVVSPILIFFYAIWIQVAVLDKL